MTSSIIYGCVGLWFAAFRHYFAVSDMLAGAVYVSWKNNHPDTSVFSRMFGRVSRRLRPIVTIVSSQIKLFVWLLKVSHRQRLGLTGFVEIEPHSQPHESPGSVLLEMFKEG